MDERGMEEKAKDGKGEGWGIEIKNFNFLGISWNCCFFFILENTQGSSWRCQGCI
jgi:hypothetical protein